MDTPQPPGDDDFTSWAGEGLPVAGSDEFEVVVSPRLERELRRHVEAMESMSKSERDQARFALNRLVVATFRAVHTRLAASQRRRLDALLRRAGLPPLGTAPASPSPRSQGQ